jgi:hypothetical protein
LGAAELLWSERKVDDDDNNNNNNNYIREVTQLMEYVISKQDPIMQIVKALHSIRDC